MSFCECLTKFLQSLDCRKKPAVSEPILTSNVDTAEKDNLTPQPDLELALQTDLEDESEPEPAKIEEIKPLTIEEADADDSEEEIPIIEDRHVRNSHYSEDLEFECDERELIKILDEKEKEDKDEDRHRFSMY